MEINKSSFLFLIGGVAASGKTTMVQMLYKDFEGTYYRPHQAFIDVANELGMELKNAFNPNPSLKKRVWNYYLKRIKSGLINIADVHFAIQPYSDSIRAIGGYVEEDKRKPEPYAPAIESEFIQFLSHQNVKIGLILLEVGLEVIIQRRKERDKKLYKTFCEESILFEIESEKKFFNQLVEANNIRHLILNNESDIERKYALLKEFIIYSIE